MTIVSYNMCTPSFVFLKQAVRKLAGKYPLSWIKCRRCDWGWFHHIWETIHLLLCLSSWSNVNIRIITIHKSNLFMEKWSYSMTWEKTKPSTMHLYTIMITSSCEWHRHRKHCLTWHRQIVLLWIKAFSVWLGNNCGQIRLPLKQEKHTWGVSCDF